jgi:hypothetical protein
MKSIVCDVLVFFGSEFWAAIVGALVGGIIAYFIQLQALREARNERRKTQTDENKSLGFSLFFKTLAIWNNLAHIKNYVEEARKKQIEVSADRLSIVLLPLANIADPVKYEQREMSLLLSLGEAETLNRVLPLDAIHNSILPVWDLYATKREALHDAVEMHGIDLDSGVASISLPVDSKAARLLFEVNQLATELAERAQKDEAEARHARDILLQTLKRRLGLEINFA